MVMVKSLNEMIKLHCKTTKKWALILQWPGIYYDEELLNWHLTNGGPKIADVGFDFIMGMWKYYIEHLQKACPIIKFDDRTPYVTEYDHDECVIFYDTHYEVAVAFGQVVGNDGPTAANQYNGPMRVYAAVIDDNGELDYSNS